MLQLTLDDAEVALLAQLLEEERGNIRNMIHHSRTVDAKIGLNERLRRVQGLLRRLNAPAGLR